MDCISKGNVASKSNMQQLTGIIILSSTDMLQTWTLSLSCYWNTHNSLSIELHPPRIQILNESCQPFPIGACRLTKTIGRPTVLCRRVWEWKTEREQGEADEQLHAAASRYVGTALCKEMHLYPEESSTYLMPTLICGCGDIPTELGWPTFVVKLEDKGNEEDKEAKTRQELVTPAICLSKKHGCRMCKRTVKTYISIYACLRLTNTQKTAWSSCLEVCTHDYRPTELARPTFPRKLEDKGKEEKAAKKRPRDICKTTPCGLSKSIDAICVRELRRPTFLCRRVWE